MKRFTSAAIVLLLAGTAAAQDSVSTTPGASDAINPWSGTVRHRYVVDLVPVTSSWGNAFQVGPIAKAHNTGDIMFPSHLLGAVALSADEATALNFGSTDYSVWSAPGAGVNSNANSAPGTVSVSSFDRRFGLGFSDFTTSLSFGAGALVGRNDAEPARLYVNRAVAGASRFSPAFDNAGTVSLGAVDASGNLVLRADDFNGAGANKIIGENIISVSLPTISTLNAILSGGGMNIASDAPASAFKINAATTTTNTASAIPASIAGASFPLVLDFANNFRPNGGAGVMSHLDAGIAAHRGNPSFSAVTALGGSGVMASLARTSNTPGAKTASINLSVLNAAGGVLDALSATLPVALTDGVATVNSSGDAEFLQYLSQVSFRGGNGQVGVGLDPAGNSVVAAATGNDSSTGDFVAVARFPIGGGAAAWNLVAYPGKPVLDGPGGATVGAIVSASPVSISSPAVDLEGNVYFVAAYQPNAGAVGRALIKAVNSGAGAYQLEVILKSGDSVLGANSATTYTVDTLTLEDSDSIASGSFFSANLLQPQLAAPTGASDPFAFGGAIVNATISYDNAGTPETYNAVLFVSPRAGGPEPCCIGNANGDNIVDFDDIVSVLGNWLEGTSQSTPNNDGDADCNGEVDFDDIVAILGQWLNACP